jgi:hypothetical protein
MNTPAEKKFLKTTAFAFVLAGVALVSAFGSLALAIVTGNWIVAGSIALFIVTASLRGKDEKSRTSALLYRLFSLSVIIGVLVYAPSVLAVTGLVVPFVIGNILRFYSKKIMVPVAEKLKSERENLG